MIRSTRISVRRILRRSTPKRAASSLPKTGCESKYSRSLRRASLNGVGREPVPGGGERASGQRCSRAESRQEDLGGSEPEGNAVLDLLGAAVLDHDVPKLQRLLGVLQRLDHILLRALVVHGASLRFQSEAPLHLQMVVPGSPRTSSMRSGLVSTPIVRCPWGSALRAISMISTVAMSTLHGTTARMTVRSC